MVVNWRVAARRRGGPDARDTCAVGDCLSGWDRRRSGVPTRPRPVRLLCPGGSTPIRSRRVARAVASVSTRRRNQPLLKPRFQERSLGNARRMSLPRLSRQRRLGGIRKLIPPLRIPYGNKESALRLGARYRAGGWYAPAGVDLAAFGERGWLHSQAPPSS